ncbi:hypothetical protein GTR02_05020 [Kineococcus sp. R8]|uniref:hypothetical protein n=1 Tax=Kineococcus siccus TaxID=2696567 RepID=UPI001411D986|nr:hypothetical protein [Kineococcus siccus]NAZ81173.1 hypothetical protein [Kineococcus siccus]
MTSLQEWGKHPVGRRLLVVAVCEVLLAIISVGAGTARLPSAAAWLLLGLWLLHRIAGGGRTAWRVLLALSVLGTVLGLAGAVFLLPPTALLQWQLVLPPLLSAVEVAVLLTAPVRGRVAPRQEVPTSLP